MMKIQQNILNLFVTFTFQTLPTYTTCSVHPPTPFNNRLHSLHPHRPELFTSFKSVRRPAPRKEINNEPC